MDVVPGTDRPEQLASRHSLEFPAQETVVGVKIRFAADEKPREITFTAYVSPFYGWGDGEEPTEEQWSKSNPGHGDEW